jgi:pre-mRNA-splicing factor ATP-dependent RNA helicase DHX15/PRP43
LEPNTKRTNTGETDLFDATPSINPLTKRPYGPRYYQILEKRKELPAWEARNKVVELVREY